MKSAANRLDKTTVNRMCFTFLLMLAVIGTAHFLSVPNPEMILLTVMVIITSLFGTECGIVSVAELLLYILFFYSADHSFLHYNSAADIVKVIVTALCSFACLLFFGKLRENWDDRPESRINSPANT